MSNEPILQEILINPSAHTSEIDILKSKIQEENKSSPPKNSK